MSSNESDPKDRFDPEAPSPSEPTVPLGTSSDPRDREAADLPRPTRLGSYPILGELGRGGMGVVYVAMDERLQRRIAIKVLPRIPSKRSPESSGLGSVDREAKLLATLNHPNIATIYSLEEADGQSFFTMELVSGEALTHEIAQGPMPTEKALAIFRQIAAALEAAHRSGIAHCDLKPQNIKITSDGFVKILDFGLAKIHEGAARHPIATPEDSSASGVLFGTPGYASPEQLRGEPVDHRTDIWAFGCLLYECLTGRPAFSGSSRSDRIALTLGGDPELAALPPEIPVQLRTLLTLCLEKERDRRLDAITTARQQIEEMIAQAALSLSTPLPRAVSRATPNNLPRRPTSFVGRQTQLDEVRQLVATARLVTLTGAGGCGKTRLALEVADQLLGDFPGGVWLVRLAPIAETAQIAETVAAALSVKEESGRKVTETLVAFIGTRKVLLILDNCEHLLNSSAELSAELLDACPGLHIVATSREAFGIPEETFYKVPALETPAAEDLPAIDKLREIEAVRLFSERARTVAPDFRLDTGNAPTVSLICRRLDGIPLALELAAARVKILTIEEIATRLDDRFRLLTSGGRNSVPHHQTLRALIDWSYEHLLDAERLLFQRLSVFAGGWTLDAAEAVGSGDGIERWEVLDLLTRLLEKSLIEVDREGSRKIRRARYRMLETVREYARDRLHEGGKEAEVRGQHLDYSLSLAEEADRGLTGADPTAWLHRLQLEHENLRAALVAATQSAAHADLGLRLMGVLSRYWFLSGHWNEARRLCERLLDDPGSRDPEGQPRAKVLNLAGNLAYWQGDYDRARYSHERSLEIRRRLNDRIGISASLNNLGNVAERLGDYGQATTYYEESMTIRRELGDEAGIATALNNLGFVAEHRMEFARARAFHEESLAIRRKMKDRSGEAMSLNNMGNVVYWLEEYDEAHALQLESLRINRELGDRWGMGWSLKDLARVAIKQRDHDAARSYLDEGLPLCREIGDRPGIAETLETIGMLEADLQRYRKAARLFGAADALRAEIRAAHSPPGKRELVRYLNILRRQLGERELAAAQDEGRSMPIGAAIEDALRKDNDQGSRPGS